MLITIDHKNKTYKADLSKPIDISISLTGDSQNPIAWYLEHPIIRPVAMDNWVGKVSEGASTNFNNIAFNPHAHGTHTECLGHITNDFYSINKTLVKFFFLAELISITPELQGDDHVITKAQIENKLNGKTPEALVIRTLPNSADKQHKNYSHTNPPYLEAAAADYIRERSIDHLLIDLPSVDREEDEGRLAAHKAFWNITDVQELSADVRRDATITEMIFVPDEVLDGTYLLNIQIASFENDASPSKPILYGLLEG